MISPPEGGEPEPVGQLPPEITGFPVWIKGAALVVAALLVFALTRIGPSIQTTLLLERSQKQMESGRFKEAATGFARLSSKYPDQLSLRLDLAEAQVKAGDYEGAIRTFEWLEGKKVTKAEEDRATSIINQIPQGAAK